MQTTLAVIMNQERANVWILQRVAQWFGLPQKENLSPSVNINLGDNFPIIVSLAENCNSTDFLHNCQKRQFVDG